MKIESDHDDDQKQSNQLEENIEEGRQIEVMDNDEEGSDDDDYLDDEEFDEDEENEPNSEANSGTVIRRTYVPNVSNFKSEAGGSSMEVDDDELECDLSAYVMYHKAETGFPCLSFDVIEDRFGSDEARVSTYPQTAYLVAGTQADKAQLNKVLVLKCSRLNPIRKPKANEEDESEDDDEETEEDLPDLQSISISHDGCVNRIRARNIGDRQIAATFSELGTVHLWDLTAHLRAIDEPSSLTKYQRHLDRGPPKPIHTFNGHGTEGFALDWSSTNEGMLASGDCSKNIFIWKLIESGWLVDQIPLVGHTDSVEDLQWSPNEPNIIASCSVDRSIRIWDIRTKAKAAIEMVDSHSSDVNVISWNRNEKAFILSGGDDGAVKVWDLRQFRSSRPNGQSGAGAIRPVATFKHHQAAITSVEWHPTDGTVFAASSDDNQITLWDLAVEADTDEVAVATVPETVDDDAVNQLPPQLLFIHQGQKEVKEVHWHGQLPGLVISTAITGFDIFRTISV